MACQRVTLCYIGPMSEDDVDEGKPSSAPREEARKERVIHTRVPAVLEQELKRLAGSLRIPVSNVVRTILEDAVATLDTVGQLAEGELRQAAEKLRQRRGALRRVVRPLEGIVGYQALALARDESCALCGRELHPGEKAYLGVREVPEGPRVILGKECLPFSMSE